MNEENQTQPIPTEPQNPIPMQGSAPEPAPATPMPTVMTSPSVVVSPGQKGMMKWIKKPLVLIILAVIIILAIGAGVVFGLYLPNTPANVYSASLSNTGKAQDELLKYATDQVNVDYKSTSFDGTLKFKSPSGSYDFDATGSADKESNASATVNADILGEKMTADMRSVLVKGNKTPDVYFRFKGIKSFLDANGLNSLDKLDNQWIAIDHTLIDTYAATLKKSVGTDLTSASSMPTSAQIDDAATKLTAVNKKYLYTTDPSTAVLANEKFIGQEKDHDRTLNHYTVGYNKDNLQAYAAAAAAALDSSSLNDWSKKANDGKSLSVLLDFDTLKSDIKDAKAGYTFDLWVDTSSKLISKLQFTDPSDSSSVFTLSQDYSSGSTYPFTLTVKGKDDSGNPENGTIGIVLHTDTNKVELTVNFMSQAADGETTVNAALNVTPSTKALSVSAPTGAKSFVTILNELGLGDLASGSSLSL